MVGNLPAGGHQKGGRSKHPLISGGDDVIDANDIISPPKTYIKRCKTVKLHTKQSEAKGRGLILHPQVTRFYKWGKITINGVG